MSVDLSVYNIYYSSLYDFNFQCRSFFFSCILYTTTFKHVYSYLINFPFRGSFVRAFCLVCGRPVKFKSSKFVSTVIEEIERERIFFRIFVFS